MSSLRLGVNVDHVATLRQARYATMPESKNAEPDLLVAPAESSPICGVIAATFKTTTSSVSART
jgi:hypothetical protein